MAANTLAWKHWTRIISRWPVDNVRPEAVSFQTLMKQRLTKYEKPAKAAEQAKVKGTAANVQPVDMQWNDAKEMKQANTLYALLENRFASVNPLPETLRFPASQPEHYDMIIRETEKAPTRGVMEKFSTKAKNMFRWT